MKSLAALGVLGLAAGCRGIELPDWTPPRERHDPPDHDGELRLVVLGDWGSGQIEQWNVAQAMDTVADRVGGFHAGLMLGDNFYPAGVRSTDDPMWQRYFVEVYDTPWLSRLPWWVILGNHDYSGNIQAQVDYSEVNPIWNMPDDFWRHELFGLTVLGLNTCKRFLRWDAQLHRLDRWLADCDPRRTIALGHHPILTDSTHPASKRVMKDVRPRLEEAGVRAYFAGHDHNQQLITEGGFVQIVQGAGGKRLHHKLTPKPHSRFHAVKYGFSTLTVRGDDMQLAFFDMSARELFSATL